jgi:hypothetical protein
MYRRTLGMKLCEEDPAKEVKCIVHKIRIDMEVMTKQKEGKSVQKNKRLGCIEGIILIQILKEIGIEFA